MSSPVFRFTMIAVPALFLAGSNFAADDLPPVQQLVATTLALCEADRDNNAEALESLAQAQAHLGDFAGARKTLGAFSAAADFRLTVANLHCAQIEIELTGSASSVSESMWNYSGGTMHCNAALAFVERREIEKALERVHHIHASASTPLNVFGTALIQKLLEQGKKGAAQEVALACASCLNLATDIGQYRAHYEVPRLVTWLVEFNERPAASELCDHWHSVLMHAEYAGELIRAKCWAEYAKALAALGRGESALDALSRAQECIKKSLAPQGNPIRPGFYRIPAEAYAAVAARRAVIFGREAASADYDRSLEFAALSIDPRDHQFGDFAYELIVSEQLTAGDDQGARETAKRAPTLRATARCWLRISSRALSRGDLNSARAAVQAASELLDRTGVESFVAEDMALVASNAARAGENQIAQKLFKRALALSEADNSSKSRHPFIARFQAIGGLLSDAYQTIQSIDQPSNRTEPLAALCLELAKRERVSAKRRP